MPYLAVAIDQSSITPGTYSAVQQTRFDDLPSFMGSGSSTVCETPFGAGGTTDQLYQAQSIVLNNGAQAEMGTGHQCADSNYPNGFEYWYAGYWDGGGSWHTTWIPQTITGSHSHSFYLFENVCGSSHCWRAQVDSTLKATWSYVQLGQTAENWLTSNDNNSSSGPYLAYSASSMAYAVSYGGWHNFSSTRNVDTGHPAMCAAWVSDTQSALAENPFSYTTCT